MCGHANWELSIDETYTLLVNCLVMAHNLYVDIKRSTYYL